MTVLVHKAASQEPAPTLTSSTTLPPQEPNRAPPPQLDTLPTDLFTAPTRIVSSSKRRRKKKNKKALTRIEPFLQMANTQAAPLIGANLPQNEPAYSFITETFPPDAQMEDDRILVEPPYPAPSPVPPQTVRESIHPAVLGVAALVLIVLLGALLWRGSGETDDSLEDDDVPPQVLSSDPLPTAKPSQALSTPASQTIPPPEYNPEPGQEPELELRSIPPLPTNMQPSRHNSVDNNPDSPSPPPPSSHAPPVPVPTPKPQEGGGASRPMQPTPVWEQDDEAMSEPDAGSPEPIEAAARTRMSSTPETATSRSNVATPPWLGQIRSDLANCPNVFCREKVRDQYCTSQWQNLPECRGASL
jgi:hypothetical protein